MSINKKQVGSIGKIIEESAPRPGFEFSENQIAYLRTVSHITLAVTMFAGFVALTTVAPNIFVALDKIFGKKQYGTKRDTLERRKQQLKRSFYYLRDQGYIDIQKRGDLIYISPTSKGQRHMNKIAFKNLRVKTPKKWEKTWWIVLADIPSKQFRHRAYYFQKKLKAIGLYPLQRTAWIHPFDLREEVEAVAVHYKLNPFITVMGVNRLDPSDEKDLRKYFSEILTH